MDFAVGSELFASAVSRVGTLRLSEGSGNQVKDKNTCYIIYLTNLKRDLLNGPHPSRKFNLGPRAPKTINFGAFLHACARRPISSFGVRGVCSKDPVKNFLEYMLWRESRIYSYKPLKLKHCSLATRNERKRAYLRT